MKWCTCGLSKTQPWCDGEFSQICVMKHLQLNYILIIYLKLFQNTLAVSEQKYEKAIFLVISPKC